MAENDLKDILTSKSRDPRKVFLRTGSAKPHGLLSEGGTSCSESDFDVSSPSTQSGSSSTSYPSSAKSPAVPHDLSVKSLKSPESPYGGPLSFPSLGSINSPYSDYGPLSVSDFLKSPGSSIADYQDIDNLADCVLPIEDKTSVALSSKLIVECKQSEYNISSTHSAPLSVKKPVVNAPVEEEKQANSHSRVRNTPLTSAYPPEANKTNKGHFDIHQPFIHSSSGHLLDKLFSPDRQKQLEHLYQPGHGDAGLGSRDVYEPIHARSPRNERYSPISKTSESATLHKQHGDIRGFDTRGRGNFRSPAVSSGSQQISTPSLASPLHVPHSSAGCVSSSVESRPTSMKDCDTSHPGPKDDHLHHLGSSGRKNHTEPSTGMLHMPNLDRRHSVPMNLSADVLTDQMAIEMLRQEVFKRTTQSLDLPPDFPWYTTPRHNTEQRNHCSSSKRPTIRRESMEVDSGQYAMCMDLSNPEGKLGGSENAMPSMSDGGTVSNGSDGSGSHGSRSGYESQVNSVSSGSAMGSQDKATVIAESTCADVDIHVCQICGDVAAGFHCGAYVCEACKVSKHHILTYINVYHANR